jgi:transcriptional regulator with XRE-family HTH domain
MISNERQYRITKTEADRFREALASFEANGGTRRAVHPRLVQAERDALQSQLDSLVREMAEYEALKSGTVPFITIDSFDELADGLIKARIAAGLSQKALADRLGLKEQQIQRYEAERYSSASFQRLQEVARAIGVQIRKEILLPLKATSLDTLVAKLRQVGLSKEFVLSRLLPSADAAKADGTVPQPDQSALLSKAAGILSRIYGWTTDSIFNPEPLLAPRLAAASARFKLPARRSHESVSLYAAYANYLAVAALQGSQGLQRHSVPIDAKAFRSAVIHRYGELTLKTVLHYAWDLGIVVLPLNDSGTFHGACWRYEGRNVIVLKQNSRHMARWLFDIIHEIFHAGQNPDAPTLELIESDETSVERRNSPEEIAASQFAGDVTLDGKAETLAQLSVNAAHNSVERLKGVVPRIASEHGVDTGALANYMAFRLSWQGINWWGAAANLQKDDGDPWLVARDVFFERFPFALDAEIDRQLIERALQ